MKTKRMMAALVVALLSVTAVMAKDIRTAVFKVSQMHCENCEKKVKSNIKFEKGVKEFSIRLENPKQFLSHTMLKRQMWTN